MTQDYDCMIMSTCISVCAEEGKIELCVYLFEPEKETSVINPLQDPNLMPV